MATPIWQDYTLSLGTADYYDYRILLDSPTGEIIYNGRARKRPGAVSVTIKLNGICSNYMSNYTSIDKAVLERTFVVQSLAGGSWTTVNTVTFSNDWSYDSDLLVSDIYSFPVSHIVDRRQLILYATMKSSVTVNWSASDGTTGSTDVEVENCIAYIDPSTLAEDVAEITVDGRLHYTVTDSCRRYVLYYVNERGGWDTLLMEGRHKESDELTRQVISVEYDNRYNEDPGRRNSLNDITHKVTLHTGWLDDASSMLMRHLLNSHNVQLFDMEKNEWHPLILTSTTTEYKTFENLNRQAVFYTIEAEFSNTRIRK